MIAVLQPRRVAAVSVAQRVAEERGEQLGGVVGYSIRFDDVVNAERTRIKFMTEGVLIREMMRDPLLQRYSVIVLDEAHERTMFMDICIGLLQKVQKRRPNLKIIVSSATLDAETFKDYFNRNQTNDPSKDTAAILSIEGRTYPVEVQYAEAPVANYITATIDTICDIHATKGDGDILAFLTGQDEVDDVVQRLQDRIGRRASVLPLYGALPAQQQMRVFEYPRDGKRKIIVATNIAEASVTIPGVVYVVDCGFVKLKGYDPETGIESLVITPISKASANQRAGRAGRIRSGAVYRLYTEAAYEELDSCTIPEMQRQDVSPVVLQLKALGIDNVVRFPFLSAPSAKAMSSALERLFALEALDDACKLTDPLGLKMAEFPLPPMQAKMLLSSGEFRCSVEMTIIVAMLQVQHVFVSPRGKKREAARQRALFSCEEGDMLTLLNVYEAFMRHGCNPGWCGRYFLNYRSLMRAKEIVGQLRKSLRRFGVPIVRNGDGVGVESILRCVAKGLFANAARYHMDGTYRSLRGGGRLTIHPSSVLYAEKPPPYLVYNDVVLTSDNFMRDVSIVEPEWLPELAPHFYEYRAEMLPSARAEKRPKLSSVLLQRTK
ncbi:DEAD/DEAH box helicase [Salpingoeca rosetta]|uniref:RNA helicase n=1 Tax=Salpingoeca rosetta (strain ATCC 50818 / BSB-021) TaxID=946362 RepID=F2TXH5_SALR5|nr:DEAD/DEAH box helicase [Salpingoeca rosetta]EGD76084.1 DEAD/DEAH box helicase [Salpingoeca rosetta]|eukprot:XP_004998259.1 DEAD/DEAH box helicase [Salpingoeca rosetta]